MKIEKLIENGYTYFISGLALGMEMICAEIIIKLNNKYPDIILEGAIPCKDQDKKWCTKDKFRYAKIKNQCDILNTLYDNYTDNCMLKRNDYIISKSSFILAISNGNTLGGTAYTIRHAIQNNVNIEIINPYDY